MSNDEYQQVQFYLPNEKVARTIKNPIKVVPIDYFSSFRYKHKATGIVYRPEEMGKEFYDKLSPIYNFKAEDFEQII